MTPLKHLALENTLKSGGKDVNKACDNALALFIGVVEGDLSQEEMFFFKDQSKLLKKEISDMISALRFDASISCDISLVDGCLRIHNMSFSDIKWLDR